jgi:hypothetical protein
MAGLQILRAVGSGELARMEQARTNAELEARQQAPLIQGLAAHLRTCWDAAKTEKSTIEAIMLKAMRQRNGVYEADKQVAIAKQGGSDVYMMITEVKCRAAESWMRDILLDDGTPPWDIAPTPIPDLQPDEMEQLRAAFEDKVVECLGTEGRAPSKEEMQSIYEMLLQNRKFDLMHAAEARCGRMKDKIEDQFAEGGWADSFNDFITDLVTYPAAFIKGPIVRRQRTLGWAKDAQGKTIAVPTERIAPEYERVNPFNIYPEPGITTIDEGYIFEHHPLTRTMLSELIGVPGYDDQAIRAVLADGGYTSWLNISVTNEKAANERKFNTQLRPTDMYDALEFWGKVSGKMLRDWGLTEQEVPDEAKEYDANVWLIGNYVIKAVLNYDPLGVKPYSKTSFIKCPGAFWGKGIPEIIEDLQNICNAAARSLVNNMGIASGPQVEVNLERIPPNEDITQVYPWKIWQVINDPIGANQPAVRFNQPLDNSKSLVEVYEKFSRLADDHSGIPAYLYGDTNVQGAGRTSSGLGMLMGAAGKGIRQVIMHIDADVIEPVVKRQFVYNMRYDEDESIKGDLIVQPKGAVNLATKEQMNARRVEFLTATANPIDIEIMGKEGRAVVLREVAKGLQLPSDDAVPSREKAAYDAHVAGSAPPPGGPPGAPPSAGPSPAAPGSTPLHPDGSPKGGQSGALAVPRQLGGGQ